MPGKGRATSYSDFYKGSMSDDSDEETEPKYGVSPVSKEILKGKKKTGKLADSAAARKKAIQRRLKMARKEPS